jgi:hypothetical protein
METNEKKPSNPSAFPFVDRSETQNTIMAFSDGMTLRDYFAGKAITGLMASDPMVNGRPWNMKNDCYDLAKASYKLADAMLKAREQ